MRPVSAVFAGSSPSYELYRHSAPSTGLIALLSEKVERQNKVSDALKSRFDSKKLTQESIVMIDENQNAFQG